MLSNAQFAQLTKIDDLSHNPELEQLAMFTLPITCEDGKVRQLWRVKRRSAVQINRELRAEEAAWEAEEEKKRQANLARYVELARCGALEELEVLESLGVRASITDSALHRRGEG